MAIQDLILAIDQGTTGTTCLLVDCDLDICGRATVSFMQHYPKPGMVEHRPNEIWGSVLQAIGQVLETSGVSGNRIAAIGITNQRETVLLWDRKTGTPIHNAIVWQDRRTGSDCERMKSQGLEAEISQITGLLLDPYFSGTKLRWILDQVEGARAKADRGELAAGTVDTFLLWKLTGGQIHATDPTNASRTLLWPLGGDTWSASLCEQFQIPMSVLPEVRSCDSVFGQTRGVAGLPDGIPVAGVIGDQQSALFAQACFRPGEAKCTYGTGAFVMRNTGTEPIHSQSRLLTTVGWRLGDETTYCLEGSSFMAGAVVQWLVEEMGMLSSPAEIETVAGQVASSEGVVLVPAHAGLGAPHWRPEARGALLGMTRGTGRAHVARAALEGIALQVWDLFNAMERDTGQGLRSLKVDGGAAANNLLMQIQADLLDVQIVRPENLETTAFGAVFMAGLGVGIFRDTDELKKVWKKDVSFDPVCGKSEMDILKANWKRAIEIA